MKYKIRIVQNVSVIVLLKTIIVVPYTHLILLYQIFQRVHVTRAHIQVAHFTAAGDQTRQRLQITEMFLVC